MRTPLLAVPLVAVGVLTAACGDDDEPASDTTPTTQATERTETERTETEPTATEPDAGGGQGGGATGPSGGAPAPNPELPDSPRNDVPPPPGSPAERFEQECQVNPEVCE